MHRNCKSVLFNEPFLGFYISFIRRLKLDVLSEIHSINLRSKVKYDAAVLIT